MAETVRLFYAVAPSMEVREALQQACALLSKGVPFARWTHPADYHITVKFIGDAEPSLAGRLDGPVREAVRGFGPFRLTLGGFGTFGPKDAPSILWCGVNGAEPLAALHACVEQAAASCGIATDTRPYRAHHTVARKYRGAEPFSSFRRQLAEAAPSPLSWRAEELILYRTCFGSRPAYEAIQRFPL